MDYNPYLDKIFSTCISLRKLTSLEFHEKNNCIATNRPQLHIMVIGNYGTGKSALTRQTKEQCPNTVFQMDKMTSASLYGSITKQEEYVPSILIHAAGKVMIIDEWDNTSDELRQSMLSILENLEIKKGLAFKVKKRFKIKKKNIEYKIENNIIDGHINFSCIAYAMSTPAIYTRNHFDVNKTSGLLSRFSPIYLETDKEMMRAIRESDFRLHIKDVSFNVEKVVFTKECYLKCSELWENYMEVEHLFFDNDHTGMINRIFQDLIRFSIHSYLEEVEPKEKEIVINDSIFFRKNLVFAKAIFHCFQTYRKSTVSRYQIFKETILKNPSMTLDELSKSIGCSLSKTKRLKHQFLKVESDEEISDYELTKKELEDENSSFIKYKELIKENPETSKDEIMKILNIKKTRYYKLVNKVKIESLEEFESKDDKIDNE